MSLKSFHNVFVVKSIKKNLVNMLHVQKFQGQSISTEEKSLEDHNTSFIFGRWIQIGSSFRAVLQLLTFFWSGTNIDGVFLSHDRVIAKYIKFGYCLDARVSKWSLFSNFHKTCCSTRLLNLAF